MLQEDSKDAIDKATMVICDSSKANWHAEVMGLVLVECGDVCIVGLTHGRQAYRPAYSMLMYVYVLGISSSLLAGVNVIHMYMQVLF